MGPALITSWYPKFNGTEPFRLATQLNAKKDWAAWPRHAELWHFIVEIRSYPVIGVFICYQRRPKAACWIHGGTRERYLWNKTQCLVDKQECAYTCTDALTHTHVCKHTHTPHTHTHTHTHTHALHHKTVNFASSSWGSKWWIFLTIRTAIESRRSDTTKSADGVQK